MRTASRWSGSKPAREDQGGHHVLPQFRDWRDQNSSYQHLAAYSETAFALTGAGEPERLLGAQVTANFFDVLASSRQAGRLFSVANERKGRRVVLISHGLWQRGSAGGGCVGKSITLSTRPHEIIGVMPPEMQWPERAEFGASGSAAAAPGRAAPFWLPVIGRLKPGVSVASAQTEMPEFDALEQPIRATGVTAPTSCRCAIKSSAASVCSSRS